MAFLLVLEGVVEGAVGEGVVDVEGVAEGAEGAEELESVSSRLASLYLGVPCLG